MENLRCLKRDSEGYYSFTIFNSITEVPAAQSGIWYLYAIEIDNGKFVHFGCTDNLSNQLSSLVCDELYRLNGRCGRIGILGPIRDAVYTESIICKFIERFRIDNIGSSLNIYSLEKFIRSSVKELKMTYVSDDVNIFDALCSQFDISKVNDTNGILFWYCQNLYKGIISSLYSDEDESDECSGIINDLIIPFYDFIDFDREIKEKSKRYFQIISKGPELNKVKEYKTEYVDSDGVCYIKFTDGTQCNKELILELDANVSSSVEKLPNVYHMVELRGKDDVWYVEYRSNEVKCTVGSGAKQVELDVPAPYADRTGKEPYKIIIEPHPNRNISREGGAARYKMLYDRIPRIDVPNIAGVKLNSGNNFTRSSQGRWFSCEVTKDVPVNESKQETPKTESEPITKKKKRKHKKSKRNNC